MPLNSAVTEAGISVGTGKWLHLLAELLGVTRHWMGTEPLRFFSATQ